MPAKGRKRKPGKGKSNQLRIIAGQWRGRKLEFPDHPGLRPTTDRVRETLFNWVAPMIEGARCLDLFAGSGALGFEALSRGAGNVIMVEQDAQVAEQLRSNARKLETHRLEVICMDAMLYLQTEAEAFDLVFLDPPFGRDLLLSCCMQLSGKGWLQPGAQVYLESEQDFTQTDLPPNWKLQKHKKAGQVYYGLCLVHPESC
jgi:16S rRNA (guanine966-N2)-methyltransferase